MNIKEKDFSLRDKPFMVYDPTSTDEEFFDTREEALAYVKDTLNVEPDVERLEVYQRIATGTAERTAVVTINES